MGMRTRLGVLAGLIAIFGFAAIAHAAITEPKDDDFYTGPADLKVANGSVLRSRDVVVTQYGQPAAGITSKQILYRSTNSKGTPIAAVTTLMIPDAPYAGKGPRPLVAFQEAIDSLGDQCNPGYTLRTGTNKEFGLMRMLLDSGYAVVATDFEGQDSAFGAGPLGGHTVLDAIKAAEALPDTGLAGTDTPVGITGYSGGSQGTMWAAELQPTYAPELNVVGIAGGGTPADLELSLKQILGGPAAGLGFLGVFGGEREYPELGIDSILNADGKQLKEDLKDACLFDAAGSYPFARIEDYTTVPDPFALPRVQAVLGELHLGQAKPSAPVYLYHSIADELIPVGIEDAFATRYCQMGVPVQYTREASGDHNTEAIAGAPAAFAWLADRFDGDPAPTNCGSFPPGGFSDGYAAFDCGKAPPVRIGIKRIAGKSVKRVAVRSDADRVAVKKGRSLRRVRVRGLKPGYVQLRLRMRAAGGKKKVRHVSRILRCT